MRNGLFRRPAPWFGKSPLKGSGAMLCGRERGPSPNKYGTPGCLCGRFARGVDQLRGHAQQKQRGGPGEVLLTRRMLAGSAVGGTELWVPSAAWTQLYSSFDRDRCQAPIPARFSGKAAGEVPACLGTVFFLLESKQASRHLQLGNPTVRWTGRYRVVCPVA